MMGRDRRWWFGIVLLVAFFVFGSLGSVGASEHSSESVSDESDTTEANYPVGIFEGLPLKDHPEAFQGTEGELVLRSVGDVLIHDRVAWLADTYSPIYQQEVEEMVDLGFDRGIFQEDAVYDFMPMLGYVAPYTAFADVTVANLEVIAATPDLPVAGYPQFNAPREILDGLADIGVDVVSNGTNHTLDWFAEGAYASIENIQDAGLMYSGSYESWADYNEPRVIEENGISLGFLTYSYGTNGIPVPVGEEYLISLVDLELMVAEVAMLAESVDAVVVTLQLGEEYDLLPSDYQFEVFQALSDAGARLILGGHPHVLQPFDWYNDGETFAIYSQASFLTGQRELDNKQGGITEVTFRRGDDGEVSVVEPKFMPLFNLGVDGEKMYQVVPMADIDLHEIPDGQYWWDEIAERMATYTDDWELVTHLETELSEESVDGFR